MTDLSKLGLEDLHRRLEELNAEWHEVEMAIEAKQAEDKQQLAQEVKSRIESAGHDVAEIVGLLVARKRRAGKAAGQYTRYVDPDDAANTYSRGVLPGWMKDKMATKGLDPTSKQDRETFKQNHLKKVAA